MFHPPSIAKACAAERGGAAWLGQGAHAGEGTHSRAALGEALQAS